MLTISICEKTYEKAHIQLQKILNTKAQAIEWRLDFLKEFNLEQIAKIRNLCPHPIIFTLRSCAKGGHFPYDKTEQQTIIDKLAKLGPTYFDLEFGLDLEFIKNLNNKHPQISLICSYHNFDETPSNLNQILQAMENKVFSFYKIATLANSIIDSLRILQLAQTNKNLLAIAMGELGAITRISAPVFAAPFNFAALTDKPSAPGQLSIDTLYNTYNYKNLNYKTKIFALLGYPSTNSCGHIFHNDYFTGHNINGVYVRLPVAPCELKEFLTLAKNIFSGFSVTMPHKETIINYLDQLSPDAKAIKAVNTILIKNNKLIGYNTDAPGALDAIENTIKVCNKKILILGAGGAARAICYEALKRGGLVHIYNRTFARATKLAKELNTTAIASLDGCTYDILINTTPIGMEGQYPNDLPINESHILANEIVFDAISRPKITKLLEIAKSKNCNIISGYDMYVNQALGQQMIWNSCGLRKNAR